MASQWSLPEFCAKFAQLSLSAAHPSQAATQAPKLRLLELPAEMIAAIAGQAEPEDLPALRRTCRAICTASHDAFVQVYFRKRTHLYSWFGLRSLAQLAMNPHFGPKVVEIELVEVSFSNKKFNRVLGLEQGVGSRRSKPGEDGPLLDEGFMPSHAINPQSVFEDEVEALFKNSEGVTLLAQALISFRDAGVTPAITFSQHDSSKLSAYGLTTLRRAMSGAVATTDFIPRPCDAAFTQLLLALRTSRFAPKSLCLFNYGVRSKTMGLQARVVRQCLPGSPMAGLRSLHISFGEPTSNAGFWGDSKHETLAKVFSHLSMLTSLTIEGCSGSSTSDPGSPKTVLHAFASCPLQSLDIRNVYTADIIAFLQPVQGKVRRLMLQNIRVPRDSKSAFGSLFDWLESDMDLEYLHLASLRTGLSVVVLDESVNEGFELLCNGSDQVREALQNLSKREVEIRKTGKRERE